MGWGDEGGRKGGGGGGGGGNGGGGGEGGMDGWMVGALRGGSSLGPKHEALAAQCPYQHALILFRVPID